MANTYTVTPNIIPGNVTIGGTLNVQGDELKVGLASPYVRVAKFSPNVGMFSVNLQKDLTTRDDVTKPAYGLHYTLSSETLASRFVAVSGAVQSWAERMVVQASTVAQVVHGAAGAIRIMLVSIRAGTLGANSMMVCRMFGTLATVAGGGFNVVGQFGANNAPTLTFPQSTTTAFDLSVLVSAQGATNSQILQAFGIGTGLTIPAAQVSASNDTTADQFFQVNVVGINASDVMTVYGIETAILNASGPI